MKDNNWLQFKKQIKINFNNKENRLRIKHLSSGGLTNESWCLWSDEQYSSVNDTDPKFSSLFPSFANEPTLLSCYCNYGSASVLPVARRPLPAFHRRRSWGWTRRRRRWRSVAYRRVKTKPQRNRIRQLVLGHERHYPPLFSPRWQG